MKYLVDKHNLGKLSVDRQQRQNGRYVVTITVRGNEFSCYPEGFLYLADALECAAREACIYFESNLPQRKKLDI